MRSTGSSARIYIYIPLHNKGHSSGQHSCVDLWRCPFLTVEYTQYQHILTKYSWTLNETSKDGLGNEVAMNCSSQATVCALTVHPSHVTSAPPHLTDWVKYADSASIYRELFNSMYMYMFHWSTPLITINICCSISHKPQPHLPSPLHVHISLSTAPQRPSGWQ